MCNICQTGRWAFIRSLNIPLPRAVPKRPILNGKLHSLCSEKGTPDLRKRWRWNHYINTTSDIFIVLDFHTVCNSSDQLSNGFKISLLFQEEIINSRVKNILEHQFCNDSKTIRNYTITVEKKANTDTHEAIKPSKFYARAVRFCSVK